MNEENRILSGLLQTDHRTRTREARSRAYQTKSGHAPGACLRTCANAVRAAGTTTTLAHRQSLASGKAKCLLVGGIMTTEILALVYRAKAVSYSGSKSDQLLRFDGVEPRNETPTDPRVNSLPPVHAQGWAKRCFCIKSWYVHFTSPNRFQV